MFGTIFIYREQIKYLSSNISFFMISLISILDDIDEVIAKLRRRPIVIGIDLPEKRRDEELMINSFLDYILF